MPFIRSSTYTHVHVPFTLCTVNFHCDINPNQCSVAMFHYSGRVSHTQTFKFSPGSVESCQNLLIPRSEIDLFSDTLFLASIAVVPESGVELGELSTAVITIEGINGKNHSGT